MMKWTKIPYDKPELTAFGSWRDLAVNGDSVPVEAGPGGGNGGTEPYILVFDPNTNLWVPGDENGNPLP